MSPRTILDNLAPPSAGQRFATLDGLRGMAVLMVLFSHVLLIPALGPTGVSIFFVLSAFLLYYPWAAGKPIEARSYFRRRFWRIYPAWLLALLVALAVRPVVGAATHWPSLVAHLGFAHTLTKPWALDIIPPAWSMAAEVQFYLVLPFIAVLTRRWRSILPLAVLPCILVQYALTCETLASYNLPFLALPFLAGMLAAEMVARGKHFPRFLAIAGVGLIGLVCGYLWTHSIGNLSATPARSWLDVALGPRGLLSTIGATSAILGLAGGTGLAARLYASPVLRCIGVCGYGIFLLHFPILMVCWHAFGPRAGGLIGLPLSLLAGLISYLHVERPSIHYASRPLRIPSVAGASSDLQRVADR